MDFHQLQYFVAIAESGSITAAAKKLFLSQPPLSMQMKRLEKELGCGLFLSGGREAQLKEANIRCSVDGRSEKMGYKIREARLNRVPYLLIVGAKEEEEQKVSVRSRYLGDEGSKDLGEFIEAIKDEIAKKTIRKIEVEE